MVFTQEYNIILHEFLNNIFIRAMCIVFNPFNGFIIYFLRK